MNFNQLSGILKDTNERLFRRAVKAVNINLTLRNWLFGYHIVEFDQNGEDRARYSSKLLESLATELAIKGLTAPELSRCRQFYNTYPQIIELLPEEFNTFLPNRILGTVSQELTRLEFPILGIVSQESV